RRKTKAPKREHDVARATEEVTAMEVEGPEALPLSEGQVEALAGRICDLLMAEPYLGRLRAALGEEVGTKAEQTADVPEPPADTPEPPAATEGPVPIGPYEIPPELTDLKWEQSPPRPSAAREDRSVAAGPRVSRQLRRRQSAEAD
ncbi:MAG: hypothetical protein ACE5JM_12445, partial [Armatimonadota bacterium]